jgi:hypothetical protein
MNTITKEAGSYATNVLSWLRGFGVAFLSLLSFQAAAQDYSDTFYLDAQTIKSGEEVFYMATNAIYAIPGKQFIVESGGYAKLQARNRIELHPGFSVEYKGGFSATIQDPEPILVDEPVKNIFTVFPNPTDGLLNISSPENVNTVRLIDMNGLALIEQTDINLTDVTLDVSKAEPGLYILEIRSSLTIERIRVEKK